MDNYSTRKRGRLSPEERAKHDRLSLADRAKQGLLGDELELHEVMGLEFPTATSFKDKEQPRYKEWENTIKAAIRFGFFGREEPRLEVIHIPRQGEPGYGTIIHYWIDRKGYQAWRTSQPEPPTGSFISLWLGATPAVETLPPAEPIPPALPTLPAEPSRPEPSRPEPTATTARPAKPSRPEQTAKGGAAEKIVALLALLDEVDKRAKEQEKGFNRHSLPGTKKEFHALAIEYNRRAFAKALSTFDGYLEGNCQFNCNGAKPEQGKGADIWALFPEYKPRLG